MRRRRHWLAELYRGHFLGLDTILPLLVGVAAIASLKHAIGLEAVQTSVDGHRAFTYGTLAGVSGSLMGFSLTLVLVMRVILTVERLAILRESPAALDLFKAILHAVVALGLLTVAAFVAILVDTDLHPRVEVLCSVIVLLLVVAWKLASAVRLMWKVLAVEMAASRPGPEDRPDQGDPL